MPSVTASLFYASAALSAFTIPKHTMVGLGSVGPATQTIANAPQFAKVRHLITGTWLHSNVYLAMSALLNIKWARSGAPSDFEEKVIVWLQVVGGLWLGATYYRRAMYAGLPVLLGAPVLTALGTVL